MAGAFQSSAFQNSAFQTDSSAVVVAGLPKKRKKRIVYVKNEPEPQIEIVARPQAYIPQETPEPINPASFFKAQPTYAPQRDKLDISKSQIETAIAALMAQKQMNDRLAEQDLLMRKHNHAQLIHDEEEIEMLLLH